MSLETYGNMTTLADRMAIAISLQYLFVDRNLVIPSQSPRVYFQGLKALLSSESLDPDLDTLLSGLSTEVKVAISAYLTSLEAQCNSYELTIDLGRELLMTLTSGTWSSIGIPDMLLGGEPTTEIRETLVTIVSLYTDGVIAAAGTTLLGLPSFTPDLSEV